ncbi:ATP-binding protein [Stenotrophomonas rhizophila]|uniref:ATP-binding protein n=1 Tax=Stenotrophomonas rhizophila TaxID=216778 RepID=UPI001E4C0CAA|nr:transporter substrate-binding domain-containing protein [Stenotrophomonas rhizophila]MCC7633971.1 transporter substrate-binding domain-containing protein [Stenotrophomonas rhizophila]MCC7663305.1 transporter substrate-binding domain-containing protein [Stenotrophomonas rhizophila]
MFGTGRKCVLLIGALAVFATSAAPAVSPAGARGAPTTAPPLVLGAQQRAWLDAHPRIVLGTAGLNWAPFEYLQDGQLKGMGIDYLQALAPMLGVKVTVKVYPDLEALIEATCAGQIDVVINVALTAARTRCMVFTDAYVEIPVALVGRKHDQRVVQDPDLKHLQLVTERGFPTSSVARLRYPDAEHVVAPTTGEALRMVADGRADAYLGNPYVAAAFISTHREYALSLARQSDVPLDSLHFAVPNAKQRLAEALDQAMAHTTHAEQQALHSRWLPPLDWGRQGRPLLSAREQAALAQPVRMGFAPNAAPVSFLDAAGSPSGLTEDYLERFRALGATLNMVPVRDWREIRDMMHSGQLDAVMGIPEDGMAAGKGWVFSRPFLTVANVIVTRRNGETVLEMRDLNELRVVLSDRERLQPRLLAQAPRARVLDARSTGQALEMVQSGQADAYIGSLAIVDRLLRERHSGDLQIAAPTDIEDRLTLGVREQYAPLVSSFDRMLMGMSPREREAIRSDWLAVEYRSGLDWRRLLRWLAPLLMVLATALVVHGVGHWRLRREVRQRRRAEQRLEEVTDNLPAVVYQLQRDVHGDLSFPLIVGDMMALFGIEAEQAMRNGRDLFARVHPDDQQPLQQLLSEAANGFLPIDTRLRAHGAAGWRWVRSRGTPYHADDGSIRWSGYWIDITQAQEQALALAEAKATAERATAAKAEFLATMSHEIRTPMSGVLGMLEVLEGAGLTPPQRQVLGVIDESARMLRQILDDILDFSKIEAGGLQLAPSPTDIRATVANVHALLAPQAKAKELAFDCHIDAEIAGHLLVDGLRLRQVLFNLLSNAIKFTAQGGIQVIVSLLGHYHGRQQLRITIADTGIGISAEAQQRLFRPFTQAETSISKHYGGTGLGLIICRRLAEAMHGSMQLNSVLGRGTKVHVQLELAVVDPITADAATGQDAATAQFAPGQRVLVVEDHPTNQALMRWRMQQLGLDAVIAAEGAAGLAVLEMQAFDVVITDCRMPGMDGYAFTEALRKRELMQGSARLPVIALTASTSPEEEQRCYRAGMDQVLTKPVTREQLRAALQRWMVPVAAHGQDGGDTAVAGMGVDWASDLPSIDALQARFGTAPVAAQIATTLHEALGTDLDNLRAALATGDAGQAHDALHRMAGGTGAAGSVDIARHLRDLSTAVARHGVAQQRSALEEVLRVMAVYRKTLG